MHAVVSPAILKSRIGLVALQRVLAILGIKI